MDFPAFVRNPLNRIARSSQFTEDIEDRRIELVAGQELYIGAGTRQAMEVVAGTRTMHVFGGTRAMRES